MPSRILLLALAALPATQAFSASLLPHAAPALRGSSVARSVTCSAGGVPGAASPLGRRGALGALAGGFVAGACVLGAPGGASAASFEEFMAAKAKKEKVQSRQASDEEYVAGDVAPTEVVAPSDPSASVSKAAVEDAPPTPAAPVDPLKSALVSILRVQEATLQEERLITTGNFKDLQRNNIKMATRMMIENYSMTDVVVRATSFLKGSKVQDATEEGKGAIEDLRSILDYFDEGAESLKASELSKEKQAFLLKAMASARSKLDKFLTYFAKEQVASARAQVIEENALNLKELPKDMVIINPIFMN